MVGLNVLFDAIKVGSNVVIDRFTLLVIGSDRLWLQMMSEITRWYHPYPGHFGFTFVGGSLDSLSIYGNG